MPSALGMSTMGPQHAQVMTSNRSTSETKQGGKQLLTIPGTSMTVCVLDHCACETDGLSQTTDDMAADGNEGEKRKKQGKTREILKAGRSGASHGLRTAATPYLCTDPVLTCQRVFAHIDQSIPWSWSAS